MSRKLSTSSLFFAMSMAIILLTVTPVRSQDVDAAPRVSRVVAPINEHQVVSLAAHLVPWAKPENDLGPAPDSMPTGNLHLMLKRSDAQESALQSLLVQQLDPQSPNYHNWLTPEEYGARFGISDADLAKTTGWLASHGFTIKQVLKANNAIVFSGTNAELQEAFHTRLHAYKVGSEVQYANASNPQVPAALSPVIAGFYSLNTMQPKPLHTAPGLATLKKSADGWKVERVTGLGGQTAGQPRSMFEWSGTSSTYHLLAPADFATIYNVAPIYKTYDGTGQTIAIVSPTDINPKDVDLFRNAFGLPAKKLNIIYNGPNPGLAGGAEAEADLDVEWSGAIAPNATVDLVVSANLTDSIVYIVNNNLAPVMSISYGACEVALQSGNAYLSELYKQASSQGITVLVAAGDSGSNACDQNNGISTSGLSVSGFASTPYNTAVGGTDFPVNVIGDASTYWNTTNASVDQHSAKSYIPEAPWNDTCASPEVLQMAQTNPDWAADTTYEALCNDPNAQQYFLNNVGGGGGVSNCTQSTSADPASCLGGYPQPAWQVGVPGVPSDFRRHLPDVSFFSGAGLWLTGYIYCESDSTPDGGCGAVNSTDMQYNIAGGTSFASPSFAGIVALLNQKTSGRVGNINPILYNLAASQFSDPVKQNSCQSDSASGTETCVFHDVAQGGNAMPCLVGTFDNPPDGVCTVATSGDQIGILSGYASAVSYDMASGLGSLNAQNLLNAWPTSLAATQTSIALAGGASLNYGTSLTGSVMVTAATGTPTGTVTLMYKDSAGNPQSGQDAQDLTGGKATVASSVLPVGSWKVYARYSGDGSYTASASADQSVTVAQAATTLRIDTSRTTVAENQGARLLTTIMAPSLGDLPSGNVVFKNATTGAQLATVSVSGYTDSSTGYSYARAILDAGAGALVNGQNQITATYSGDASYASATASAPAIQYTGAFTITASSSTLTLTPGATSGNTVLFTVTPGQGVPLSASALRFSCPGSLPPGVSCQFSAPTASANGAITSTLTLALNSPLAQKGSAPALPFHREAVTSLAFLLAGGAFLIAPVRRARKLSLFLMLGIAVTFTAACGTSKRAAGTPTVTTSLAVSSATPAYNTPVTLTATVSSPAATGTISFFDGTTLLGSSTVKSNTASITTSSLSVGKRTLTAAYSGDSSYPAATSSAVTVDVTLSSSIMIQAVDTTNGNFAQQTVNLTVQ